MSQTKAKAASRQRQAANRMLFTDLGIKRLKPPKAKQELYWDALEGQKGLALLVSPGGTKTFRSQFKFEGKWQTRTVGRFGEMSEETGENVNVAVAREMARKDRVLAKQGIDPRQSKKPSPSSTRYGDVVDQFIELYAKPRQRTWKQTEGVLKRNCRPFLNKPISSIGKRDAYNLLDKMVAEGHGPKARVTLSWLKSLWRWAWKRDLVSGPTMDKVEIHYEKKSRDRVYSDDEIRTIWCATDKLSASQGAFIKLLLLLGPRKTALAQMRRAHLDDAENPTLWTTPFELTKSKKTASRKRTYLTPLPPLAQRVLKGLKPRPDAADLLFPGQRKGQPINPGKVLVKQMSEHGGPADFNFHAARHTIATWLENEGHSEYERGLVLNHSGSGVTAGYSHGYPLELKRQVLCKWADHVEKLVTAEGIALLR